MFTIVVAVAVLSLDTIMFRVDNSLYDRCGYEPRMLVAEPSSSRDPFRLVCLLCARLVVSALLLVKSFAVKAI
ncbi:hypothetical protein FOZ61_003837 [Perkinsus olseni]|uniref:Uncharacterized protein n=1 Tax=Perkinsus olseni TaxID=32597 RepID=A0A7J6LNE2_PEROL|nr:hypothetical protein FOZ61_003837 [Perkinsus olseni]